jgi:hypothetical protein
MELELDYLPGLVAPATAAAPPTAPASATAASAAAATGLANNIEEGRIADNISSEFTFYLLNRIHFCIM